MRKIILITGLSFVSIIGLCVLSNRFVKPLTLSTNALYLRWTVSPGKFFIPDPDYKGPGVMMESNLELSELDNGLTVFLKRKEPGTFRIFCVGGSTTRGWPFHERLSYPFLLNLELKDLFPHKKIEVINAGTSATDSWSDVHLVRQIMNYDPNLILIYEGRNEVWNIPLHVGWRSWLLPLHVWLLRNFYLYRHLCYCSAVIPDFDHAQTIRDWVSQSSQGQWPALAIAGLKKNLVKMTRESQKHHCAVIFLTQVIDPGEMDMTDINNAIRRVAYSENIPLIDLEKAFQQADPMGRKHFMLIPGTPIHPNIPGYLFIAQFVARRLAQIGIIAPWKEWRWNQLKSNCDYLRELSVTPKFMSRIYLRLAMQVRKMGLPDVKRKYLEWSKEFKNHGALRMKRFCTKKSDALHSLML